MPDVTMGAKQSGVGSYLLYNESHCLRRGADPSEVFAEGGDCKRILKRKSGSTGEGLIRGGTSCYCCSRIVTR